MPYPAGIAKLSFGGGLPRGDTWSMNLFVNYDGAADPVSVFAEGYGDVRRAITAALVTWFKSTDTAISSNCFLQWVKLNAIGPDGKYLRQYTNEWLVQAYESSATGNGVNGVNGVMQWPHLSMAVTHRAAEARGAATRGRTYPPMVGIGPNNQGIATEATLRAYANTYVTMLSGVAAAIPGEGSGTPLIVSKGTKANPNVGTKRPIARVEVGNVIDVQQRRRNADAEDYTAASTVLSGQAGGATGLGPNP